MGKIIGAGHLMNVLHQVEVLKTRKSCFVTQNRTGTSANLVPFSGGLGWGVNKWWFNEGARKTG